MFRSQGSELVMGSMLALAIEAVLDFADERRGHFRLIACEAASHEAYGTSRDLFIAFFAIIRETLRDLLGDEWSPDIAEAEAEAWDACAWRSTHSPACRPDALRCTKGGLLRSRD